MAQRIAMVNRIRQEHVDQYRQLHAGENPGVRDLLTAANMTNFSIFIKQLPDGELYLFGYYDYVGDDFEADMEKLAAEPRNKAWLEICDPMQQPLPGETSWAPMEEVYHNP